MADLELPDDPRPELSPPPPAPDPVGNALTWVRRHEPAVLTAAVAFQLLLLAAVVVACAWPTYNASTVLLRVIPVDPRDLMRGDYVILGYEIARSAGAGRQPGDTVYVTLVPEPDGRHYRDGGAGATPPASGRFIRGTVDRGGRVAFGIESYFVQEGAGKDYEKAILSRRLSAEVALAADGRAALNRLVFD